MGLYYRLLGVIMNKREPVFVFDNLLSTGIDKVPNDSMVTVLDYSGASRQVVKVANTNMTPISTIQDFFLDLSLFTEILENVNGGGF